LFSPTILLTFDQTSLNEMSADCCQRKGHILLLTNSVLKSCLVLSKCLQSFDRIP